MRANCPTCGRPTEDHSYTSGACPTTIHDRASERVVELMTRLRAYMAVRWPAPEERDDA